MHSQEVSRYIVVDSSTTVEEEISEQNYFPSQKECEDWVSKEDPEKKFRWDIFHVDITHVTEISD